MHDGGMPTFRTSDPRMKRILTMAENVAASRATILIEGESGTGKEVLAKYIHNQSPRAAKKWVAINCAAMPEGLLESELFGYEKGAFTGAYSKKIGKLEMAQGGTFLLDEVHELPPSLQAKILRVLQENEIDRLGGKESIRLNVRIIATSNRSLKKMVEQGLFRADLYYRLNVIRIEVPPLRERPGDVVELARFFMQVSRLVNNRNVERISNEALQVLKNWSWPGNVRELENVMERSVLLCEGDQIEPSSLLLDSCDEINSIGENHSLKAGMSISEVEKKLILATLEHTTNNRSEAARMLGISIRTLRNKLNLYREQGLNV